YCLAVAHRQQAKKGVVVRMRRRRKRWRPTTVRKTKPLSEATTSGSGLVYLSADLRSQRRPCCLITTSLSGPPLSQSQPSSCEDRAAGGRPRLPPAVPKLPDEAQRPTTLPRPATGGATEVRPPTSPPCPPPPKSTSKPAPPMSKSRPPRPSNTSRPPSPRRTSL